MTRIFFHFSTREYQTVEAIGVRNRFQTTGGDLRRKCRVGSPPAARVDSSPPALSPHRRFNSRSVPLESQVPCFLHPRRLSGGQMSSRRASIADAETKRFNIQFVFQMMKHLVADRAVIAKIDQGQSFYLQRLTRQPSEGFARLKR